MEIDAIAIAREALETEMFATAIYSHLAARYPDKPTRKAFTAI